MKYITFCLLAMALFSCEQSTNDMDGGSKSPSDELPTILPSGNEAYLNLESDYLFDQDKLPTFEITISNSNFSKLNNDPAAEEYVEAMLVFEGDTISPVGLRYKGSVGAFVGCVSGDDWANPHGIKTCTKLSMKIKINWEGREEKFYGVKKVQLHAMNLDDSQLRDRLGYYLFKEMGVPTPRSNHARLVINGEFIGLFAHVEQVDGRFSRYHFENGKGNVYKEIWPINYQNQAYTKSTYTHALETNEDENPDVSIIQDFGKAMANSNHETEAEVLNRYLDLEEALSYWVVDRMIRHDDGPAHFYCNGAVCTNHNYFWYEDNKRRKLHLIPWDLDNAFENIIRDANPVTPVADAWGEISESCKPFRYGSFGIEQKSAACDKIIGALSRRTTLYNERKMAFLSGPFSKENTDALIEKWSEQLRQATQEASQSHADAISIGRWEQSIEQLKQQLEHARNN